MLETFVHYSSNSLQFKLRCKSQIHIKARFLFKSCVHYHTEKHGY